MTTITQIVGINRFRGMWFFLSNFYTDYDGFCVENHYQAAKTTDPKEYREILYAATPGEAKRLGRNCKFLRPDWDSIKLGTMLNLLRIKFRKPHMKELLLSTCGSPLVEGNDHKDRYWGVCKGVGQNHLGKLLMKIRKELEDGAVLDGERS